MSRAISAASPRCSVSLASSWSVTVSSERTSKDTIMVAGDRQPQAALPDGTIREALCATARRRSRCGGFHHELATEQSQCLVEAVGCSGMARVQHAADNLVVDPETPGKRKA